MQPSSMQGLRLLVAEDEPLAALVIEEILTAEGCSVCLAEDGETAFDLARREHFDLLVTDLAMPRMSGLELIQRLRELQPEIPVVVMTGYLSPAAAEALRTQARPPIALLQKPFDIDRLVDIVAGIAKPQPVRAAC